MNTKSDIPFILVVLILSLAAATLARAETNESALPQGKVTLCIPKTEEGMKTLEETMAIYGLKLENLSEDLFNVLFEDAADDLKSSTCPFGTVAVHLPNSAKIR